LFLYSTPSGVYSWSGLNQLKMYWISNSFLNSFIVQTLPDQMYIMDLQGHLNGNPPCPFAKMNQGFYAVLPFTVDSSVGDKMLVNTEV